MSQKLPLGVRITDIIHRSTVLGLVGICVVGLGSVSFNLYANSDFARMNSQKLKFDPKNDEQNKE